MTTETLTHAWTARQPFAYTLAAGWKPIENKTERPPLHLIGKLVGIHAGLQWCRPEDMPCWPAHLHPMPAQDDPRLTFGALIGVAGLVGVVRVGRTPWGHGLVREVGRGAVVEPLPVALADRIRPWWRGPWGWLFEEAVLLPEPIPMKGQQGLWRLPEEVRDGRRWGTDGDGNGAVAQRALEQWHKARGA